MSVPSLPVPSVPRGMSRASAARAAATANAYQSVAQSAAIAVQDAADNLRNLMTISTTAIGVAMAQYLATQDSFYLKVIQQAQRLVATGTTQFTAVGKAAARVVSGFPSGGG